MSAQLNAQSAYAGLYTGYLYQTITGDISIPRSSIGPATFTVDESGNIIGNTTGTVDGSGNITWNANTLGFTTGMIDGGGELTATVVDVQASVTITWEIEAQNQAGGFGSNPDSVVKSFEWRVPTPVGGFFNSVAYGDGKFVAVGEGGVAAWSGNGTDWFSLYIPAGVDLNGVAYGDGRWVVVGDSQTAFYSDDLETWTPTAPGGAFQNINDVAYGNGKFIVAGLVGVYSSTDATGWSTVYSNGTAETFDSVQYENGLFIIAVDRISSAAGKLIVSTDGTNWSQQGLNNGVAHKAVYGNGTYVLTFSNGYYTFTQNDASDLAFHSASHTADSIGFVEGLFVDEDFYTSSDGQTFTRAGYIDEDMNDFASGGGRLVGVGGVIVSSMDGISWSLHTRRLFGSDINRIGQRDTSNYRGASGIYNAEITNIFHAEGSSGFLRVGQGGRIELDSDGNGAGAYEVQVSPTTQDLNDAIKRNSGTLGAAIVGDGGTIIIYDQEFTPGSGSWELVSSGTTVNLNAVESNNSSGFVIAGDGGTLLVSTDYGLTWSKQSVGGISDNYNNVTYVGTSGLSGFYVYGDNGAVVYNNAALNAGWTDISIPDTDKDIVGLALRTVTQSVVIAIARDGTIFYTNDKATWTEVPNGVAFEVNDLGANGSTFVGDGGFDGVTVFAGDNLTPVGAYYDVPGGNLSLTSVLRGNGRFVAVGDSTVAVSTDGYEWLGASVPSSQFQEMAYGNGVFIASGPGPGAQPVTYQSVDGLNWEKIEFSVSMNFKALSYGNGVFVGAVDGENKFFYSTDGTTWTAGTSYSGHGIYDIEFINGHFIAVGTTSFTSTDGMSWSGGTGGTGGRMYDVAYYDGLYVAAGDNGNISSTLGKVISSTDGLSWTNRTPAAPSPLRIDPLRAVRNAGGKWITVGDNNTNDSGAIVLDSDDGITWNVDYMNFDADLFGLAAANGQLIAVGQQGTIFGIPYEDSDSPYFTSQPSHGGTVNEGGVLSLSAAVSGTGTLQYQWLRNGVPVSGSNVSGATTASLTINPVSLGDAGTYTLSIWNDFGSVISQEVTIEVLPLPVIETQPVSYLGAAGGTASFTVSATGDGLTYQWYMDNVMVPGATSATLSLSDLESSNAGRYYVTVTNTVGTVYSNTVTLSVQTLGSGTNLSLDAAFNANVPSLESTTIQYTPTFSQQILDINEILVLPSGKIIVAGQFEYDHPTLGRRSSILRLNADGSIDETFIPPTIVIVATYVNKASILSAALLSDGRIAAMVGGSVKVGADFTTGAGGTSVGRAILFNADGTVDLSFTAPNGLGTSVYGIAVDSSDRILISGYSVNVTSGVTHRYVTRIDDTGTPDTTFNTSELTSVAHLDQPVDRPFMFQSDGKILVAGYFNGYNNMGVFRLNTNGTVDGSFGVPETQASWIQHLFPSTADGFYVVDNFNTVEGRTQYGIGKFDADGNLVSSYTGLASAGDIWDGRELPGGAVLAVGASAYSTSGSRGIALLDETGDSTPSGLIGTGFAGIEYGRAMGSNANNSVVYVGGNVTTLDGNAVPKVIKFNASAGGGTPPALEIVKDPQNVTAEAGDNVSFSVAAIGGTLTFQWYHGDDILPGQTGPELALADVQIANEGEYTVEVTDESGTITSTVATLSLGGGGGTSYAAWSAAFDFGGGDSSEDGDPDGDGISNLLEFIFDTDPTDPSERPQVTPVIVSDGDDYPGAEVIQLENPSGVTVTVEAATDPGFVNTVTVVEVLPAMNLGDGTVKRLFRVESTVDATTEIFFRLKAETEM